MNGEQMKVLSLLEEGKITADEAAGLLGALGRSREPRMGQEIKDQISPIIEKVVQQLDKIPEQVATEHLPKIGKGVGRVVDALSGILNQGLGMLDTHLQPTHQIEQDLTWSEMEAISGFELQNTHGTLRVVGADVNEISIRVRATIPAETLQAAQDFLAANPVILRREGHQILLSPPASLTQYKALGILHRHRFDFECRIPRRLQVQISSLSGNVLLESIIPQALSRIKSISGDITLRDVEGEIELNTMSGEISGDAVRGICQMRTISGDIEIADGHVAGRLTTVSGEIKLAGSLKGELIAKTISGDVEMRVLAASPLSISSTSGDIDVEFLNGSAGYVEASTRSGDIRAGLDLEEALLAKRHIKGKLFGSNTPLTFSSISGDILLERND